MTIYIDDGEAVKIYPVKNKVAKAIMTLLELDDEMVWSKTHAGYGVKIVESEDEACGMKRAWEAARKIYDIQNAAMVKELFGADANYAIYNFTASEAIKKIEAWEKKHRK